MIELIATFDDETTIIVTLHFHVAKEWLEDKKIKGHLRKNGIVRVEENKQ